MGKNEQQGEGVNTQVIVYGLYIFGSLCFLAGGVISLLTVK